MIDYRAKDALRNEYIFHHLIQAISTDRIRIYINGVLQTTTVSGGTLPTTTSGSTPSCLFGGEPSASPLLSIDEVRLWDTVLSGTTINAWKDKLLGDCHPNVNRLVLYWPLDNDANPAMAEAGLGTSYSSPILYGSYVGSSQASGATDCASESYAVLEDHLDEHWIVTHQSRARLYPNPTRGTIQIDVNVVSTQLVSVQIVDMYGRYVYRKQTAVSKGLNRLAVDMTSLRPGHYFVEVRGAKEVAEKFKVVKK